MPGYQLTTNVKLQPEEKKVFLKEFSKLGKELVGFPTEDFVVITYEYQEDMIFGGTFDPAFRLQAVAKFTAETNPERSATLFKFLTEKLGISMKRGIIEFRSPSADFIGAEGTTAAINLQRLKLQSR